MNPFDFPYGYDFQFMWAASRLALEGGNIYDLATLHEGVYRLGWPPNEPFFPFPYPPWTLWLFLPFGLLPLGIAKFIWSCLIIISVCFAAQNWVRLASKRLPTPILVLSVITFPPISINILYGQTNFVPLLGLVLCFQFLSLEKPFWGGLATSLCLFKPHLLYPFLIAVTISTGLQRKFSFHLGLIVGLFLQLFFSSLLFENGLSLYRAQIPLMMNEMTSFLCPAVSQILHSLIGQKGIVYFFLCIGAVGGVTLGLLGSFKSHKNILLTLSLVTIPYGWSHSFILLLHPYLDLIVKYFEKINEKIRFPLVGVFGISLFLHNNNFDFLLVFIPVLLFYYSAKCEFYSRTTTVTHPRS